jgi:single-strand DNA-binding protein
MNKVIISGRTTADIELKTTPSGTSVASFTVAVDYGYGEKKQTSFLDVVAWQKQAENAARYVHKGDRVIIDGRLQTRVYESNGQKRKVTEIVANEIEFIETKRDAAPNPAPIPNATNLAEIADDDELPF